ncbi:MAG: 1-acyl-sn-glycerol-3-phosphate acyltransferase [Gammaproteobacteria bacterium]|nr:MAG: 1-acyl-sn-glycerol-3-phosphate acyltransferase [Gammaproteobacteria bacterium]
MNSVRSLVFTSILFLTCVPCGLVIIAVRVFGTKASYRVAMFWCRSILWWCRVLCGLDFTVEGQENIPARNCVVFLKHSSAYEAIAQWLIFPNQCWVLKRELIWAPFFGWALACLQPISIDRGAGRTAVEQVVRQGKLRLAEGCWVMIYPEGTRMAAGKTRRYGVSGTLLAEASGGVILPVAHNAGDFWPRRGWRKKAGLVRFVIGPTIDPAGREAREVNEEIQSWIERTVAEIRAAAARHPSPG